MTPEELIATTDGGTDALQAVPDLELRMADPEAIAVDPMNERTDEPLDTEDLERSVAENGVVEPPVCRIRNEDAKVPYTVVQGQRRVTAAQVMQLDEIPILVGEFDDKRALVRSITENIKAGQKDVTTITRARAIWELWKLHLDEKGESVEDEGNEVPNPSDIADLLAVGVPTASRWIEPLKADYANTVLDPRKGNESEISLTTNNIDINEIEDISPKKLKAIRDMSSVGDDAEEKVKRVVEENLTVQEVKEVEDLKDADTSFEEAVTQVKTAKEAAKEAKGFTLDALRFDGKTGGALSQVQRKTGKTRTEVVMDAVRYYLREEGFL